MHVEKQCAFVVIELTMKAHPVMFTTESDILPKILVGGRLGQNSTTLQRQMVSPYSTARKSRDGADRGEGEDIQGKWGKPALI
jgi:hypothetical protein